MGNLKPQDRIGTIIFLGVVAFIGPFHLLFFASNSVYLLNYKELGQSILIATMIVGIALMTIGTILYKKPEYWQDFSVWSKFIGLFVFVANLVTIFLIMAHEDATSAYEFADAFPIFSMMTLWLIARDQENFKEEK